MSTAKKKKPAKKKRWKRIVFGFIRWTWIPVACIVALAVGLTIGYVYIGNMNAEDIWEFETWRHIYDLVFANT